MVYVSFTQMKNGTYDDYKLLEELEHDYISQLPNRLIKELRSQGDDSLAGYQVTRLEHALQSATRAWHDNAGDEWVVAALLHDISDGLAPQNHDKMAAEIMRPYMRDEIIWVIANHGIFQTYYFGHHYGWDRHAREQFKDNLYYQTCVDFCERWDQCSFDPQYKTKDLEFFIPMVHNIFSREAYHAKHQQLGVVKGLKP